MTGFGITFLIFFFMIITVIITGYLIHRNNKDFKIFMDGLFNPVVTAATTDTHTDTSAIHETP